LSLPELQRTLSAVPKGTYKNVKCYGLYGTYDDGLEWLRNPENLSKPKCILSLGSSIGNFTRDEAANFIKGFAQCILRPGKDDLMLIGVDACKDPEKVWRAYSDSKGITEKFILNGLLHANHLLGEDVFRTDEWKYIGEYNEKEGRHEAFFSPVRDFSFRNVTIKAGERVRVEESYKYSITESTRLWEASGLLEGARWGSSTGEYRMYPAYVGALRMANPNAVSCASCGAYTVVR
jgi:L-histidine Nalpha-methyltransferase / hercynylcysteine S-oxide synthase